KNRPCGGRSVRRAAGFATVWRSGEDPGARGGVVVPRPGVTRVRLSAGKGRSEGRSGVGAAPAGLVLLTHDLGVRRRADDGADLDLLVRLDGELLGAAVRLAPDDLDLGADRHVGVDGRQGEAAALVRAVAGEQGEAD